jgi:hypothetical protein
MLSMWYWSAYRGKYFALHSKSSRPSERPLLGLATLAAKTPSSISSSPGLTQIAAIIDDGGQVLIGTNQAGQRRCGCS